MTSLDYWVLAIWLILLAVSPPLALGILVLFVLWGLIAAMLG